MRNSTKILIIILIGLVGAVWYTSPPRKESYEAVPCEQRLDSLQRRIENLEKFMEWQKIYNGAINDSLHLVK